MKRIIIYYNESKTCFQVIQTSEKFNGDVKGLVDTVTGSDDFTKSYHDYNVL